MGPLLPYRGDRAQHFGPDGKGGHVLPTYGADFSGKVTYAFNSLGFRGDEFDPESKLRVFASGCSYTFGVAVQFEHTWAHHVRLGVAKRRGLAPGEVNLLNFAQGGASNDYLTRTLLTQVGRCRPDLVVALFTYSLRCELILDDGYRTIGPWALRTADGPLDRLPAKEREYVELAVDYYRNYAPAAGVARTLQSIVLLQSFLRARGIPHVLAWVEHAVLDDPDWREHPVIGPLVDLVDRSTLCPVSIMDPGVLLDRGADGCHPGPGTHALFAAHMLSALAGGPSLERDPSGVASAGARKGPMEDDAAARRG